MEYQMNSLSSTDGRFSVFPTKSSTTTYTESSWFDDNFVVRRESSLLWLVNQTLLPVIRRHASNAIREEKYRPHGHDSKRSYSSYSNAKRFHMRRSQNEISRRERRLTPYGSSGVIQRDSYPYGPNAYNQRDSYPHESIARQQQSSPQPHPYAPKTHYHQRSYRYEASPSQQQDPYPNKPNGSYRERVYPYGPNTSHYSKSPHSVHEDSYQRRDNRTHGMDSYYSGRHHNHNNANHASSFAGHFQPSPQDAFPDVCTTNDLLNLLRQFGIGELQPSNTDSHYNEFVRNMTNRNASSRHVTMVPLPVGTPLWISVVNIPYASLTSPSCPLSTDEIYMLVDRSIGLSNMHKLIDGRAMLTIALIITDSLHMHILPLDDLSGNFVNDSQSGCVLQATLVNVDISLPKTPYMSRDPNFTNNVDGHRILVSKVVAKSGVFNSTSEEIIKEIVLGTHCRNGPTISYLSNHWMGVEHISSSCQSVLCDSDLIGNATITLHGRPNSHYSEVMLLQAISLQKSTPNAHIIRTSVGRGIGKTSIQPSDSANVVLRSYVILKWTMRYDTLISGIPSILLPSYGVNETMVANLTACSHDFIRIYRHRTSGCIFMAIMNANSCDTSTGFFSIDICIAISNQCGNSSGLNTMLSHEELIIMLDNLVLTQIPSSEYDPEIETGEDALHYTLASSSLASISSPKSISVDLLGVWMPSSKTFLTLPDNTGTIPLTYAADTIISISKPKIISHSATFVPPSSLSEISSAVIGMHQARSFLF